eukprot:TRINITY_DN26810_c0_g1_i1.p1 TRINITY_DN26810_c0_g1~~TRINITY_DN26810_c0_g1_i1.p1  ORF type:complete len:365 (+),score=79.21 TRINITY_DN26810_c0_g1_i1:490-1584(+)
MTRFSSMSALGASGSVESRKEWIHSMYSRFGRADTERLFKDRFEEMEEVAEAALDLQPGMRRYIMEVAQASEADLLRKVKAKTAIEEQMAMRREMEAENARIRDLASEKREMLEHIERDVELHRRIARCTDASGQLAKERRPCFKESLKAAQTLRENRRLTSCKMLEIQNKEETLELQKKQQQTLLEERKKHNEDLYKKTKVWKQRWADEMEAVRRTEKRIRKIMSEERDECRHPPRPKADFNEKTFFNKSRCDTARQEGDVNRFRDLADSAIAARLDTWSKMGERHRNVCSKRSVTLPTPHRAELKPYPARSFPTEVALARPSSRPAKFIPPSEDRYVSEQAVGAKKHDVLLAAYMGELDRAL